MAKQIIDTALAPPAIGTYSQAVKVNDTVYLSGQIAMHPETGDLVSDDFKAQAEQMFQNLKAVCQAAGGDLADIVKLNLYLTDLANFAIINEVMGQHFEAPYPARAAIQVSALPKGAKVEVDGVMVL
tara:strand:+ start:94882 stop:95262 length:381 start_codon:yes stop_codon:yes gene_type:complete